MALESSVWAKAADATERSSEASSGIRIGPADFRGKQIFVARRWDGHMLRILVRNETMVTRYVRMSCFVARPALASSFLTRELD